MNRSEFKRYFNSNLPVVLPVIHVIKYRQACNNIDKLIDANVGGCFLINHDFSIDIFLPIIRTIRNKYPNFWIGINFLAVTGRDAFPVLAKLTIEGYRIDGYWADDARIDEHEVWQIEANDILEVRRECGWEGLYFGGTAFKKQRPVDTKDYAVAAKTAANFMDIVTTSGEGTGIVANIDKIKTFRYALPDKPIALASGITSKNVYNYSMVDCFMVSTGINFTGDFYNIDPHKLYLLTSKCEEIGDPQ